MLAHVDRRSMRRDIVERLAVLAAPAYRDERHLFGSQLAERADAVVVFLNFAV